MQADGTQWHDYFHVIEKDKEARRTHISATFQLSTEPPAPSSPPKAPLLAFPLLVDTHSLRLLTAQQSLSKYLERPAGGRFGHQHCEHCIRGSLRFCALCNRGFCYKESCCNFTELPWLSCLVSPLYQHSTRTSVAGSPQHTAAILGGHSYSTHFYDHLLCATPCSLFQVKYELVSYLKL